MGIIIPKEIAIDEPCARLIFHPLMVSGSTGKLRREAMLPHPNSKEVSLIRLKYTTIEKCMETGRRINYGNNTLWGYATVREHDIEEVNKEFNDVEAHIYYAPMHKGEYVSKDVDLYVDDENVDMSMHSDMIYSEPLPKEDCAPRTAMRKYASCLVKRMNYSLVKMNE